MDPEDEGEKKEERISETRGVDAEMEEAMMIAGGNTWWMWRIFLATSLPGILSVWVINSWVFLAQDVGYRCRVAELDKAEFTDEQQRNLTDTASGSQPCGIPDLKYGSLANMSFDAASASARASREQAGTKACDAFVFDEEGTSIKEEFSLVCDRLSMMSDIQMVVALGKLVGSFIFGICADKWGRKLSFVISSALYIFFGICAAFVPWFWALAVARFMLGMASSGCYNCGCTLFLEVVRTKLRGVLIIAYNVPYGLGMLLLALVAYFVRPWRPLQFTLAVPALLLIVSCLLITESPRWLVMQGQRKKAWRILEKANKTFVYNKNKVEDEETSIENSCQKLFVDLYKLMAQFVTTAELRWRLLICLYNWIFTTLVYYTLTLNSENFATDRYIYMAVSGVIECLSYVLPIPFLRWFGRRPMSAAMYTVAGVALLVLLTIPNEWSEAVLAVAMVGRLFNGSVYAVMILHSNELFPTEQRNTAMGLVSAMSQIGGMVAPYIVVNLGRIDRNIPGSLCGAISLVAAFLVLFLPETRGRKLLNTVEEMEEEALTGHKVTWRNLLKC